MNLFGLNFGSPMFLGIVFVLSALSLTALKFIMTDSIRLLGAKSWLVYLLFGWVSGALALPITGMLGESSTYAVPVFAFAFILSFIHMQWIMPNLAEEYHVSGVGAGLTLALFIALATLIAAYADGTVTALAPPGLMRSLPMPT
jgi:hypothetical protein